MSALGTGWTPAQRKANRRYFAALKKSGKSAWTPERKARFQKTMAKKRAANKPPARAHKPAPNGNGVDIDAATPRANGEDAGGQHYALDLIPDRMPLRAATPARPRKVRPSGEDGFPGNTESARLAVAMQLLRTIERLLRLDE